jgi:hypothetical protein
MASGCSPVLAVLAVGVGIWFARTWYKETSGGEVRSRRFRYVIRRDEKPAEYWFVVGFVYVMTAVWIAFAVVASLAP